LGLKENRAKSYSKCSGLGGLFITIQTSGFERGREGVEQKIQKNI
jgi:hypothetical protein